MLEISKFCSTRNPFWHETFKALKRVINNFLKDHSLFQLINVNTSLAQLKIGLKISFDYKGVRRILMVTDWILEDLGQVEHQKLCW